MLRKRNRFSFSPGFEHRTLQPQVYTDYANPNQVLLSRTNEVKLSMNLRLLFEHRLVKGVQWNGQLSWEGGRPKPWIDLVTGKVLYRVYRTECVLKLTFQFPFISF
jgi:hypothetical protein